MFISLDDVRKTAAKFRAKVLGRERSLRWLKNHPDKANANSRKWRQANPEKYQASLQKHEETHKATRLSRKKVNRAKRSSEGKCLDCGGIKSVYESLCNSCQLKHRELERRLGQHDKWEPGMRGPGPILTDEEILQGLKS